jgi:hypothetical protein
VHNDGGYILRGWVLGCCLQMTEIYTLSAKAATLLAATPIAVIIFNQSYWRTGRYPLYA